MTALSNPSQAEAATSQSPSSDSSPQLVAPQPVSQGGPSSSTPSSALAGAEIVRSKTPPHPTVGQGSTFVDRLLQKKAAAEAEGILDPSAGRAHRLSFGSHKRSETLPALAAIMGNGSSSSSSSSSGDQSSSASTDESSGPDGLGSIPPPGLMTSGSGLARPGGARLRHGHGRSSSLSTGTSGVASMFAGASSSSGPGTMGGPSGLIGGGSASGGPVSVDRPSHLRHVRNRSSGGSQDLTGSKFMSTGSFAGTSSWRDSKSAGPNEGRELLPRAVLGHHGNSVDLGGESGVAQTLGALGLEEGDEG